MSEYSSQDLARRRARGSRGSSSVGRISADCGCAVTSPAYGEIEIGIVPARSESPFAQTTSERVATPLISDSKDNTDRLH
jgi:hypothetical protein